MANYVYNNLKVAGKSELIEELISFLNYEPTKSDLIKGLGAVFGEKTTYEVMPMRRAIACWEISFKSLYSFSVIDGLAAKFKDLRFEIQHQDLNYRHNGKQIYINGKLVKDCFEKWEYRDCNENVSEPSETLYDDGEDIDEETHFFVKTSQSINPGQKHESHSLLTNE